MVRGNGQRINQNRAGLTTRQKTLHMLERGLQQFHHMAILGANDIVPTDETGRHPELALNQATNCPSGRKGIWVRVVMHYYEQVLVPGDGFKQTLRAFYTLLIHSIFPIF
jgi:hypothetical protein